MNTQTWIKRSEREPTKADMPVMAGYYDKDGEWTQYAVYVSFLPCEPTTHWRSIKCDPPPRELTQRERDERFAATIVNESLAFDRVSAVLMGMHRERREVAKWLDAQFGVDWGRGTSATKATREIRARLDEQGAK